MRTLKQWIIMLDTETCNIIKTVGVMVHNNLVYNIGLSLFCPSTGEVALNRSYIINEIFFGERERMDSCYYARKIPQYLDGIANHRYTCIGFFDVLNEINRLCKDYNVVAICAHNARFDIDALNTTCQYLKGMNYIRALPQDIEIWDSVKMARSIILPQSKYQKFCKENNYMTKHKVPRPRLTAEILYRFIVQDNNFKEAHTALEDVKIEIEIVKKCYKAHKKMKKVLYTARNGRSCRRQ